MCLFKNHWFPKISRKPKTVFKVLDKIDNNTYLTPFERKRIEFEKPLKARHHIWWFLTIFKPMIEGEGIHSYVKPAQSNYKLLQKGNLIIFFATIPPYTLYWEGLYGDIASTELIVHKRSFNSWDIKHYHTKSKNKNG